MRTLALDLGERRIGVALSDASGWLAMPLTVVTRTSRAADMTAIRQLVQIYGVELVVAGFPRSLDGTVGPQGRRIERYVLLLREHLPVPVVLWDESYSTVEAERLMHETGRRAKRSRIDAIAAAVILQSYLDAQRDRG